MRSKGILYLSVTDYPDYTATAVQQIKTACAIARCGAEIEFVSLNGRFNQSGMQLEYCDKIYNYYRLEPHPYLTFHTIQVPGGRLRYRTFITRAAYYASRIILRGGAKVLWTKEPRLILAAAPVAYARGAKLLFEAHDLADVPGRANNFRARMFHRLALYTAHFIVTVTKTGRKEIVLRGIPAERIVIAPDAADPLPFPSPRTCLTEPVQLAYVGSLNQDRGVDTLVQAISLLPGSLPTELTIVGGNPEQVSKLKSLAADLRTGERIKFTGYVSHAQVQDYLSHADILIQPMGLSLVSTKYASPMKLFEYMAAGRPIIACNVPTIREVADENHLFLCQPDNPASMATTIQFVVQNWPLALERAERARNLFLKKFTFEHRARTILNAIKI